LKELGEREVTLKDELQPLQGRLAGNWDELKGLEEDFRQQGLQISALRDDVAQTIERHLFALIKIGEAKMTVLADLQEMVRRSYFGQYGQSTANAWNKLKELNGWVDRLQKQKQDHKSGFAYMTHLSRAEGTARQVESALKKEEEDWKAEGAEQQQLVKRLEAMRAKSASVKATEVEAVTQDIEILSERVTTTGKNIKELEVELENAVQLLEQMVQGEMDRDKFMRLIEADRARVATNIQNTDRHLIATAQTTADLHNVLNQMNFGVIDEQGRQGDYFTYEAQIQQDIAEVNVVDLA
jgi:predicted  nucleic acid-binding Zn-ribbon protein